MLPGPEWQLVQRSEASEVGVKRESDSKWAHTREQRIY